MGGERETVVAAKDARSGRAGEIRLHESASEIHFHKDSSGQKVAVPVARWYSAWSRLSVEPGSWEFFDAETCCILSVKTELKRAPEIPAKFLHTVEISISQSYSATPEFESVDRFTNG